MIWNTLILYHKITIYTLILCRILMIYTLILCGTGEKIVFLQKKYLEI